MQYLRRIYKTQLLIFLTIFSVIVAANAEDSTCYGTTSDGSLEKAVQLPQKGQNFIVFSQLAWLLGRTYVHSKVAQVIIESFEQLARDIPGKKFMFAETGWPKGGAFPPHKTHQSGLSVDFMVPVVDLSGQSVFLPISFNNKLGYAIEFNEKGQYEKYQIDFESMAHHLRILDEQAKSNGFAIRRVIFDPQLQPLLFESDKSGYSQKHLIFNAKQAWVRHDEHYHVDFEIGCEELKNSP